MKLIDRATLLWQGGLNVGPPRAKVPPADLPPVAGPDDATVVAGGSVTSDVTGNDTDPEGGGLTVVEAVADRGTVAINPDGTLLYTAPADFSGMATITYTVADPAGNESRGTVSVEVVRLAVAGDGVTATFAATPEPGRLTIGVTAPADLAGDYLVRTADLALGPVNLAPPRIAGTAAPGQTLTARPGLWAFDEAAAPLAVARAWTRGAAPIAGAVGATYTVASADAGATIGLVETATTAAGSRSAGSAGMDVPAAVAGWTPAALPGLALWLDASEAGTVTLSGGGAVDRLADRSGNGRDAVAVPGAPAPTLGASLGGRPVLRFPAGGALRSTGPALPGLPGMPGATLIAVTQAHVAAAFSACLVLRDAAGTSGQYVAVQTGYSMMWFGNGNRYWTLPPAGPMVAVASYPPNGAHGGTEWWRDGAALGATGTSKPANSASLPADAWLQVGNQDGPSSEQAECLLVLGPLGAADRQKTEGYLAHKWGLAGSLPPAHPYKAAPPAT